MNAELAGFVGGSANNTPSLDAANDHGLASKFGMIALFDGRIEGVHVHVDDRRMIHGDFPKDKLREGHSIRIESVPSHSPTTSSQPLARSAAAAFRVGYGHRCRPLRFLGLCPNVCCRMSESTLAS